ncbi:MULTISPECIES: glycosyltransferase family 4 protein [unclassified Mycolicibacterium]|uniref:glycosyltransferase family 4 protein n=1 Tax=unclassified Mycolicibacterium TaxID=2636767 RepID=UPI001305EE1F|nr:MULTISPECIES: glycosyltransferase family 4 protein [unclassified Mycolicibacterium]MUL81733.1 glycosyltransferase family 4 protein [Mycolicibacterium sp. CBMA 329]MUL87499.1 glycosyltransferase family 4 protein [Mycolicibacterium sp. CBMA 331]MUL99636.1 glycosyltransferase family 4 protein [Mycolicibacterium sp. CBMA 334]MUM26733.1 glycosyltransferase family 4 protein [Mycolicibacterium sp. CBMA 295]MUM37796.1 glycosyltransferase family 4 protein [Mycolicibacterium sp. CBMA 247]
MLWLSPWMRPLARIYAEALRDAGAQVLLVTSDQHPGSDTARPYELVLDPRPKTLRTWPESARAALRVKGFSPDVVVSELVRDPRWLAFAPTTPRVELVHDDRPHDAGELRPRWERELFDRRARGARLVAFSRYVADAVGAADVVPLTSDLADGDVPDFVPAADRRDFVLLGRINGYKNIDVCLQAWQKHTAGRAWAGDNLVLLGDGEWRGSLPNHVVWQRKSFRYEEVLPVLARAKGSLVHYRRASQSGVQVLAMQLGVTPIVSTSGALPEFQPAGEAPIDVDDVEGLARAFDELADGDSAALRGAEAREHYRRTYSAPVSARALLEVLSRAADR